jgi:hypothetical protein
VGPPSYVVPASAAAAPPPQPYERPRHSLTFGMHSHREDLIRGIDRSLLLFSALALPWTATAQARLPDGWRAVVPPTERSQEHYCANYSPDLLAGLTADGGQIVVSAWRDNARRKQLAVPGGLLEGWDGGEWGGGVLFRGSAGGTDTLIRESLHAFAETRAGALALVGIAHLSLDRGSLFHLEQAANGRYRATHLADLGSEPRAVLKISDDSLLVASNRRVLAIGPSGSVATIFSTDLWWGLYPNSIVRDSSGAIYVGMRGAVARIRLFADGYRQDWLVDGRCQSPRTIGGAKECECFNNRLRPSP